MKLCHAKGAGKAALAPENRPGKRQNKQIGVPCNVGDPREDSPELSPIGSSPGARWGP